MTDFRYLIDTTKKAMAAHPGAHVIIDSHAGGQVIALCPLTDGNEPICEGDYSFAPLVQRALEQHGRGLANLAKLSALVRAAFEEGHASGRCMRGMDKVSEDWEFSQTKPRLRELLTGVPATVNAREVGEFGDGATVALESMSPAEVLAMLPEPVDLVIVEAFKPGEAK